MRKHRCLAALLGGSIGVHLGLRPNFLGPPIKQVALHRSGEKASSSSSSHSSSEQAAAAVAAAAALRSLTLVSSGSSPSERRAFVSSRESSPASLRALPQIDWAGSRTGWNEIERKELWQLDFWNIHGVLTISCIMLFLFQLGRIALHLPPSNEEVWITTAIYLPWIFFCWRDCAQLENHYRVTFYASCGWALMSLASLHSVVLQDKVPDLAFNLILAGNVVFAGSCIYFYGYHLSRMWRHYQQSRFRPLWIPGLLGLLCLHGLTIVDFAKRLDDQSWWKTVCTVFPDEWWWVADVRIIELFVTAAALGLIILHIQGVFTGMKNAVLVVVFTIFVPLVVMVMETTWLHASAWQHYLMVGPKYW